MNEQQHTGRPFQDTLNEIRRATFTPAFRGYDRAEVDHFVEEVARQYEELLAWRSPEAAVQRALDRVGNETASILKRARETAEETTRRSRAQADDRIRRAEEEARTIIEQAEQRLRELEADIDAVWRERARLIEEVRGIADALQAVADDAAERETEARPQPPEVPHAEAEPGAGEAATAAGAYAGSEADDAEHVGHDEPLAAGDDYGHDEEAAGTAAPDPGSEGSLWASRDLPEDEPPAQTEVDHDAGDLFDSAYATEEHGRTYETPAEAYEQDYGEHGYDDEGADYPEPDAEDEAYATPATEIQPYGGEQHAGGESEPPGEPYGAEPSEEEEHYEESGQDWPEAPAPAVEEQPTMPYQAAEIADAEGAGPASNNGEAEGGADAPPPEPGPDDTAEYPRPAEQ